MCGEQDAGDAGLGRVRYCRVEVGGLGSWGEGGDSGPLLSAGLCPVSRQSLDFILSQPQLGRQ